MDIGNFCNICDVTFTSDTHAKSHYTGKKHKKKADFGRPRPTGGSRRNCVLQELNGETASDWSPSEPKNGFARDDFDGSRSLWHQNDDIFPRTPNESGHLYYCNPCMKNFSGPSPMKQHMASPSHDKQVKKLKAKFAKDSNNNRNGHPIPYWKDLSLTGQPRSQEYEKSSESSEGSGKLFIQPKGDTVRSGSVASLQSLPRCSGANDLRSRLIGMCMAKLKEELGRIIPSIAESVVDSVVGSLIQEEKLSQADETSSQDQDGSRTPCLNLEEPNTPQNTDDSGENGQKLSQQCTTGNWVEKHTAPGDADDSRNTGGKPAARSPHTSEESGPINVETDNASINSGELANQETGAKVARTGEDRDGDIPVRCEPTDQQRCFQDRNGPGVQGSGTQTASSTNYSEANEDDYVEIYGVQMKKGRDFVLESTEPITTDPAAEETMFDLKSATRGELESRETSPRDVHSVTDVGHIGRVTSQDLIDFEEMKNAQNEQSVVMLDHQVRGDPQMIQFIDHKHNGNYDSGIECKSPKGSDGEPHDTNFQKHGSGSPVMDLQSQQYGLYYGAGDNGRRPFAGDQPLPEECGWRYH